MNFKNNTSLFKVIQFFCLAVIGVVVIFNVNNYFFNKYRNNYNESQKKDFNKLSYLFEQKLESYIYGLQGLKGIYLVSNFSPTRETILKYAKSRNFYSNFNGALGFGFIRKIKRSDLNKYLIKQKKINSSFNFRQINEKNLDLLFIIESIEPLSSNKSALGLDVASEVMRRTSLLESLLTGEAIITNEVQLVQVSKKEAGYLVYMPVFDTLDPLLTSADREKHLVGFTYAPLLASSIFNYLSTKLIFNHQLNIQQEGSSKFLVNGFDSKKLIADLTETKNILGKNWIISAKFAPDSGFIILNRITYFACVCLSLAYLAILFNFFRLSNDKLALEKTATDIESWIDTVLDNVSMSVISTDLNGIIKSINAPGLKMLGFDKSELVNINTPAVFHDLSEIISRTNVLSKELNIVLDPGFETFVIKTRKKGVVDTNEWTYIAKSGERILVRLSVTAIWNKENDLIGFVGIAEDITQMKEMEILLNSQRVKMIESSRLSSLGEIAAGIAHEVNNPIAIIDGSVNLIPRFLNNPEKLEKLIESINKSTIRVVKIIKGLKKFSRADLGSEYALHSLKDIASECILLLQNKVQRDFIQINLECNNSSIINCNEVEIEQVIINFISNAIDAVKNRSERWIRLVIKEDNNFVYLNIIDSGPGIPIEIQNKIFDPFFTTKKVGEGTGLGLSISVGILAEHGATVQIIPSNEQTCFEIKFKKEIKERV